MVKRLHVIGRKNHGKTTFVVELVTALVELGLRVGTIKFTPHQHEPDQEGKDTYRHRFAGANPATLIAGEMGAIYFRCPPGVDVYRQIEVHYGHCDLVLVEGDEWTKAPKIEVWRQIRQTQPLALDHAGVAAVVTDDSVDVPVAVWPHTPVAGLAGRVLDLVGLTRGMSQP